jgi:hypothetical protein
MKALRQRYGHAKAKASAEKAVAAVQLYRGALGLPINTQQRFYTRMQKAIERAAQDHGMTIHAAWDQITSEAAARGQIVPRPGKDY